MAWLQARDLKAPDSVDAPGTVSGCALVNNAFVRGELLGLAYNRSAGQSYTKMPKKGQSCPNLPRAATSCSELPRDAQRATELPGTTQSHPELPGTARAGQSCPELPYTYCEKKMPTKGVGRIFFKLTKPYITCSRLIISMFHKRHCFFVCFFTHGYRQKVGL